MDFEKQEKSDFWKNEKICWRYHHFTHVYQKPQSYEVQFLRYEVRQNFLSFWAIFCLFNPLSPNNPQNCNFKKMEKISGDVIILNLCNKKTRPNDVCLLRYGVFAQTSHFRPVFAFLPHYWPQNLKFWKNAKHTWTYYPFTHVCH